MTVSHPNDERLYWLKGHQYIQLCADVVRRAGGDWPDQLGVVHILPREKVHVTVVWVVRGKEILEGLNVAIGPIMVAAGVIVLRKKARTPEALEIVTSSDMRSESSKIEITHLARLKSKFSLIFPAMQLFRIRFQPRAQSHEVGSRARS